MFQDLDDPLPLPDARAEQRQAVLSRGAALRRRRRARVLGIPAAAAAAAASAVLAISLSPSRSGDAVLTPAAPPPPELVFDEDDVAEWSYDACSDPEGDSAGEPDVTLFSLDRPIQPWVHYHWKPGPLNIEGLIELRYEATSGDGQRSRQLIARTTVDGEVVEQFVRDPRTGARRDVPHHVEGPQGGGLGAGFPRGALSGLGDGSTVVWSIRVNGTVVDSCDSAQDPDNQKLKS